MNYDYMKNQHKRLKIVCAGFFNHFKHLNKLDNTYTCLYNSIKGGGKMYQEERIQQIQQLLEGRKRLSKKEIMEAFQISSDTARRDILEFLKTGTAVRTHGGIMSVEDSPKILSFGERTGIHKPEKEQMANRVLEEIAEDSTLFLDSFPMQKHCPENAYIPYTFCLVSALPIIT